MRHAINGTENDRTTSAHCSGILTSSHMAMHDKSDVQALVVWPSAPLTNRLVSRALSKLNVPVVTTLPAQRPKKLIQWSTYDVIDHELTLFSGADSVLSSSYIIRKALIRKHYLSRSIRSYTTKRPASILHKAFPKTWEIELTYADELDEFWADDLYDLGEELDSAEGRWYILKPGMADRGMGIRMFNSKDALRNIFEEFEGASDDEDEDEEDGDGSASTAVVTSQLRHFVVQVADCSCLYPCNAVYQPFTLGVPHESIIGRSFPISRECRYDRIWRRPQSRSCRLFLLY